MLLKVCVLLINILFVKKTNSLNIFINNIKSKFFIIFKQAFKKKIDFQTDILTICICLQRDGQFAARDPQATAIFV